MEQKNRTFKLNDRNLDNFQIAEKLSQNSAKHTVEVRAGKFYIDDQIIGARFDTDHIKIPSNAPKEIVIAAQEFSSECNL